MRYPSTYSSITNPSTQCIHQSCIEIGCVNPFKFVSFPVISAKYALITSVSKPADVNNPLIPASLLVCSYIILKTKKQ